MHYSQNLYQNDWYRHTFGLFTTAKCRVNFVMCFYNGKSMKVVVLLINNSENKGRSYLIFCWQYEVFNVTLCPISRLDVMSSAVNCIFTASNPLVFFAAIPYTTHTFNSPQIRNDITSNLDVGQSIEYISAMCIEVTLYKIMRIWGIVILNWTVLIGLIVFLSKKYPWRGCKGLLYTTQNLIQISMLLYYAWFTCTMTKQWK